MKKSNISKLLNKKLTLSEKFHKQTGNQSIPFEHVTSSLNANKIDHKAYIRFPEIKLNIPKLINIPNTNLYTALKNRRSSFNKHRSKITIHDINSILYYSSNHLDKTSLKRPYPSAGMTYPLEIYLISNQTSLISGLYHYYLKNHSLEKMWEVNEHDLASCFFQDGIATSSLIIIITAIFKRTTKTYRDRGYRYILLEAGHLAQNIQLISTSQKHSCSPIGGFKDARLNKILDIEGVHESSIYVLSLN